MSTKTKRQAFFEVSLSGLKATSAKILVSALPAISASVLPAMYVVLSAGVDNAKKLPRACTHALRSISRRLAKGLFEHGEYVEAIQLMTEAKLLVDVTPNPADRKTGTVIYQVSPNRLDDLVAVSHDFIGMEVLKEGEKRVHRLHQGPANLAGLLDSCEPLGSLIDEEQARCDAVQTFFHLLSRQNFKKFGGVDPAAIAGLFRDCIPGENPVADSSFMPIAGGRTAQVRFAVAPDALKADDKFSIEVLGSIPAIGSKATPEERLAHAITQLVKAQLLYRSAVLWSSDPRARGGAKPLATIAVRGSWMPKTEQEAMERGFGNYEFSAQPGVDKLLHDWCTLRKSDRYNGDSENLFWDTQIYRYVVPNKDMGTWVLLDQYRVRWWAATDDAETALVYDNRRTKNYLGMIAKLVIDDVESY